MRGCHHAAGAIINRTLLCGEHAEEMERLRLLHSSDTDNKRDSLRNCYSVGN